ncbi:MAG: outer membrane protein transport protein, partial [Moraxella osloensis]|nr:outer membrane protein transport protein [Moraxella osloensis]
AFATNGDHLIGLGAKARGMGGIGIGMSHGAESALANPAMITSVKGTEVSFGGTVFMPDVETEIGMGQGSLKSDADLSVIPEVAIAQNVSDNFSWGIGMFGTAGMGVDYRDKGTSAYSYLDGNYQMVTNLQLMQFAVPLAYKENGLSFGIAPVLQYGSLDINYVTDNDGNPSNGITPIEVGEGVAQDFGMGYNLGLAYEMGGLMVGASYKSAIDMEYKKVISGAAQYFGLTYGDHLEQPAELGVGVSFTEQGHTFAFDYKRIKWSDAKGYKDFGWDDQNVFMIGYQFGQDNWALRAGYNYAKSPIKENNAGANQNEMMAINVLNLLGFPATVESHYTVGGSYAFGKTTSLDVAYVYAPEATDHFNQAASGLSAGYNVKTKHSQSSVSAQLNFNF